MPEADAKGVRQRATAQEKGVREGEAAQASKGTTPPFKKRLAGKLHDLVGQSNKDVLFNTLFACSYMLAIWSCASTILEDAPRQITMFLFHRMLGAVFVVAFVSIWVQIMGLCGENGILPIKDTMDALAGMRSKRFFPTIFWFSSSDAFIRACCGVGLLSSFLYCVNVVPTLFLAISWVLFLSFKVVGREFFALQFDNLLLDTGLFAFLIPPIRLLPFFTIPTTHFFQQTVLWLVRWLGFRLMVGSGWCKITSGDPTWRNGTALCYHYWTQPMPNWISYYADRFTPLWAQRASCYFHFFVELVVPYGLFFSSLNFATLLLLSSLQVGIIVTGNYGFFNLLSILIPFAAMSDNWYPRWFYNSLVPFAETPVLLSNWIAPFMDVCALALVFFILILTLVPFAQVARGHLYCPDWVAELHSVISPFGIMNYYGLFARMTTSRREVIIEGSDGNEWREYKFRYKVDDPGKFPCFVIGHLPRLDWRLWFCQFQRFNPSSSSWYDDFLMKLLQGSPEVTALLQTNPFPDQPPKYLRSLMYDYELANEEDHKKGWWWTRTNRKLWWPPCALDESGEKMVYLMRSSLLS